ncbi:hypothetical protein [Actinoplanes sp. G11-F43]|uniref:hypothetical protein n=1 Tax=Actinoplanes sp. G11-F43 TaxID=3424130 RepID=UPI003D3338E0
MLYLHGTEPDTPDGDARLAVRVFGTDLPGDGYRPTGHEDELAVHLLVGEIASAAECDFGGDTLFAQVGEALRRTFGGRAGLRDIARRAVI